MAKEKTKLHASIDAGGALCLAELSPPRDHDPEPWRAALRRLAGRIHALGVSDNRDGVRMSALAASTLAAGEGVEPILHMTCRDRNRVALQSDGLGAAALGVRNLLLTSGTHQTLGVCKEARNVYDVDPLQLLEAFAGHTEAHLCLGAVASPFADPMELQVMRLQKKIDAGARFLITQPVFDLDRFLAWWEAVTAAGIHEKAAVVAGIQPVTDGEAAKALAEKRPSPRVPNAWVARITDKATPEDQRTAGLEAAVETIQRLKACEGLRGFDLHAGEDPDAALEIMEKAGLGA